MGDVILKCQNLYKHIGKKEILKGISFEIGAGDILGFIVCHFRRKRVRQQGARAIVNAFQPCVQFKFKPIQGEHHHIVVGYFFGKATLFQSLYRFSLVLWRQHNIRIAAGAQGGIRVGCRSTGTFHR